MRGVASRAPVLTAELRPCARELLKHRPAARRMAWARSGQHPRSRRAHRRHQALHVGPKGEPQPHRLNTARSSKLLDKDPALREPVVCELGPLIGRALGTCPQIDLVNSDSDGAPPTLRMARARATRGPRRRARDSNPWRNHPLAVFKTAALGHYASPPDARTPRNCWDVAAADRRVTAAASSSASS